MSAHQGRFIVIEGLEGAGKSTAINTIERLLKDKGKDLVTTREPGGTHAGELIRRLIKGMDSNEQLDARAELLLLYAARIQLVEQTIKPALERGCWVLADRFELSTFAYQGGGRKLDFDLIEQLSAFSLQGFHPDLTIFLDVTPEKGLQRAYQRGQADRIEQEALSFFNDVHDAYHRKLQNMAQVVVINADQSYSAVQDEIRLAVETYESSLSH